MARDLSEVAYNGFLTKAFEEAEKGNKEASYDYLLKAYKTKKTDLVIFNLFVYSVGISDYENALKYLMELKDDSEYRNDLFIYFRLISHFIELPKEIANYIDNIRYEDVKIKNSDTRFENRKLNNFIRKDILDGRFESAFSSYLSLQKRQKLSQVEYVMFRLLSDKLGKQKRRIISCIKNDNYEELYNILSTIRYISNEELVLLNLLEKLYDSFDGMILHKESDNSETIGEAVVYKDFDRVKELAGPSKAIKLLTDKILQQNQFNIENNYTGELGNYFYETCDKINDYLSKNRYDEAKIVMYGYLQNLDRELYSEYANNILDILVLMDDDITKLYGVLADFTYVSPRLDINFVYKLFDKALTKNMWAALEKILETFKLISTYGYDIDLDYLNHLYLYKKYEVDGIEYEGVEDDKSLYDRIDEIHASIMKNNEVAKFEPSSRLESLKIQNKLNKCPNISYIDMPIDDKEVIYVKKRVISKEYNVDEVIHNAKYKMSTHKYAEAIKLLERALANGWEFNYSVISLLAYAYRENNEIEKSDFMVELLNNLSITNGIDDVVGDIKLSFDDLDQDFMYQIDNIELILNELFNTDISMEDLVDKYHILDIDVPYIYAIAARESYKVGDIDFGDYFLNLAEKLNSKDYEVKKLIKGIKANRLTITENTKDKFVETLIKTLDKKSE